MSCPYYSFRSNDWYCNQIRDYVSTDVYYAYCRNYDYESCPNYEISAGGCYLTSACVEAKGLADNCPELTLLREFRDGWLTEQSFGKQAIEEYYRIAPEIVVAIDRKDSAKNIWSELYESLVAPCVELIRQGEYEKAYQLYWSHAIALKRTYCDKA